MCVCVCVCVCARAARVLGQLSMITEIINDKTKIINNDVGALPVPEANQFYMEHVPQTKP